MVVDKVMVVPTNRTKPQAPGHTAVLSHLASLPSVDSTRVDAAQCQVAHSLIPPKGAAADVYILDTALDLRKQKYLKGTISRTAAFLKKYFINMLGCTNGK